MGAVMKDQQKVYIPGVRKITWDTGEMCEFASALVSALGSLGETVPYDFLMGASGVAFRFTIDPGEWDFGNYSVMNVAPEANEPIRRAFEAAGFSYDLRQPGSFEEDFAQIKAGIDRGVPVLARPVVGPSDFCVLAGYDEGGQVLLGWSTYQDLKDDHDIPHDVTGYFRKPGWHEHTSSYILVGEKIERPPLKQIYLNAFRWAVSLLRMPGIGKKATGLEGLKVWAGEMTEEKYFPVEDQGLLGWRYVGAAINMTMLRDHCEAVPFLERAQAEFPEFRPELDGALDCYREVRRIRAEMDNIMSDNFNEQAMKAIAVPETRRAYADAILQIRDAEDEAARHLDLLLQRY